MDQPDKTALVKAQRMESKLICDAFKLFLRLFRFRTCDAGIYLIKHVDDLKNTENGQHSTKSKFS